MTNVPTRIKNLRIQHNLKQSDVAAYLDIPQQTYSNYERNKHELPAKHVIALAKLYKVSTDFILGTHPVQTNAFNPDTPFIQDISFQNILQELNKLNQSNRQKFFRVLSYLNQS